MKVTTFDIEGLLLFEPPKFEDERGYFVETFRQSWLEDRVGTVAFQQENSSLSRTAGTVRGLHFQVGAKAQAKLVTCLAGRILDVAVDIRPGSPTFGQHVRLELDSATPHQFWIPAGFAHGFSTLTNNCLVCYKVTETYSRDHERALLWNDADLGIDWQLDGRTAILSEKDQHSPRFRDAAHQLQEVQ